MKSKLRPVGTVFEVVYPPIVGSTSTNTRGSIIKYRVIAHETSFRSLEDKVGILSEVIEAIDIIVVDDIKKLV